MHRLIKETLSLWWTASSLKQITPLLLRSIINHLFCIIAWD
jgi:hypothetical protein